MSEDENLPAQCHPLIKSKKKKVRKKMKQCKLCGTPFGNDPTIEELEKHWKSQHNWHWKSNKEKTPSEALLKNRI